MKYQKNRHYLWITAVSELLNQWIPFGAWSLRLFIPFLRLLSPGRWT